MQGGDRDWLIAVSAGRYRLYSTTPDWYSPLKDTIIYLHLSQRHLHAAINPLDQIQIRAYGERPPMEEHQS